MPKTEFRYRPVVADQIGVSPDILPDRSRYSLALAVRCCMILYCNVLYPTVAVMVSEYPNMECVLQSWLLVDTLQSVVLMNLVKGDHFPLNLYKRGWEYSRCCHLQTVHLFLSLFLPCILVDISSDIPNKYTYTFI